MSKSSELGDIVSKSAGEPVSSSLGTRLLFLCDQRDDEPSKKRWQLWK